MSHYFYDLTHFRLGQKYKNIFVCFLVQMKSLEFVFQIYWPLPNPISHLKYLNGPLLILSENPLWKHYNSYNHFTTNDIHYGKSISQFSLALVSTL